MEVKRKVGMYLILISLYYIQSFFHHLCVFMCVCVCVCQYVCVRVSLSYSLFNFSFVCYFV